MDLFPTSLTRPGHRRHFQVATGWARLAATDSNWKTEEKETKLSVGGLIELLAPPSNRERTHFEGGRMQQDAILSGGSTQVGMRTLCVYICQR